MEAGLPDLLASAGLGRLALAKPPAAKLARDTLGFSRNAPLGITLPCGTISNWPGLGSRTDHFAQN
jgi:hypothetical protein